MGMGQEQDRSRDMALHWIPITWPILIECRNTHGVHASYSLAMCRNAVGAEVAHMEQDESTRSMSCRVVRVVSCVSRVVCRVSIQFTPHQFMH